jgi:hypothetical protein
VAKPEDGGDIFLQNVGSHRLHGGISHKMATFINIFYIALFQICIRHNYTVWLKEENYHYMNIWKRKYIMHL